MAEVDIWLTAVLRVLVMFHSFLKTMSHKNFTLFLSKVNAAYLLYSTSEVSAIQEAQKKFFTINNQMLL